ESFYQYFSDLIEEDGIERVYVDFNTSPLVAVYSDDKIVSGTIGFNITEDSTVELVPLGYLKPIDVFEDAENHSSYLILSNWTKEFFARKKESHYYELLVKQFDLVYELSFGSSHFYVYKMPYEVLESIGR
ncbi:MAG: hypothetical protein K5647_01370, partial [Clostridiales bacterium]|nr:hypothetical protein [Clostridiales bacterium]